jgi:DnaJ-class molecular chaperone
MMANQCERCDDELQMGEVTLCGECQEIASKPTVQPADMFYDKCPHCRGDGVIGNPVIGIDECFLCGGNGYMPAGIRKAQVDKTIADLAAANERIAALVRELDETKTVLNALTHSYMVVGSELSRVQLELDERRSNQITVIDIPDKITAQEDYDYYAAKLAKCLYCEGSGVSPMSDNVDSLPCPACSGTGKRGGK